MMKYGNNMLKFYKIEVKMKKIIKRILMIIGGIIVVIAIIFAIMYFTSDKLICKLEQGSITLIYNNKKN